MENKKELGNVPSGVLYLEFTYQSGKKKLNTIYLRLIFTLTFSHLYNSSSLAGIFVIDRAEVNVLKCLKVGAERYINPLL